MIQKLLILLTLMTLGEISLNAQDYSVGNPSPLFGEHDMLEVSIRGDLKTLLDDVGDDRREHTAIFQFVDGGDTLSLNVKIQTRGNYRRDPDHCVFPPLKINFIKKQVKGTLFEGIDKIKLVTHCRPNSKTYQQYVLGEYLVYRVFNIITDTGFRVRPCHIKYIDEPSGKKSQESYAFFIEPDDAFEDRFQAKESKKKYYFQDSTRYAHMTRLAIFQYLVGNTDWAVSTLHNIKLFATDSMNPPYAIPYDFDWCGVVSTVYAKPMPRFEIESVSDRLFRGYCRSREEFLEEFEFFKTKKEDIYYLYESFEYLRPRQKKDALKFYENFYEIIDNDGMIDLEFMDRCLRSDRF